MRARPPPPQQPRTQAPHLAQRLRTPSASPGPRPPPLHGHRAAKSQPGKDRLGAACLSAKYWNRLGWGRGARRARPLASLRARSALPLQTRGGQVRAPRPPLDFVLLSSTPTLQSSTKLELTRGPSGSGGAKWGAASPISSLLPKPLQTHTPFTQQRPRTPETSRRTARPGLGRGVRGRAQPPACPLLRVPSPADRAAQTPDPRPPPPFLRGQRHRKFTSTPITLLSKRPPTQTPACPSPQSRGRLRIGLDPETPGGFDWISHLTFSRLLRHRPPDHLPPEWRRCAERKPLQSRQGWGIDWRSGLLGRGKRAFPPGVLAQ